MADKLIFPIGFDLEAAVKQAQGDAPKLLRRLQTTINSKPLALNLKLDEAGTGSINNINARMRELVKQWNSLTEAERIASKTSGEYTVEAKKILAEYTKLVGASESYARTLQQIDSAARRSANTQEKLTAKQRKEWEKLRKTISSNANTIDILSAKIKAYQQRLNGLEVGSEKFNKTAEKIKKLSQRLDEAKHKVAELTGKMPATAKAVNQVSEAFRTQDGYISRLLKRMAVYAGYSAIGTFLTNVREVTAQFELQRVSLGAIIQDQQRANQLFAEIKSFALTSPLKILDLTKYTKQVAAYGIEANKLFDTTKMLADISVGLGTDLSRLTLFFGQVYATGYLRASELRQATEAGIPLVDKLAKKLSEANGKLVSAAEVMDLISKRAISFEQVEEVFKDMTSAGGEFYNMQVKQSQTLFGMWSKLGDAAALMYDQIGNTSSVNSVMKTTIGLLEKMMRNWQTTGTWIGTLAVGMGTYAITLKNASIASKALTFSEGARLAITKAQVIATPKLVAAIIGQNAATKLSTVLTKAHTAAMLKQSVATNVLSRAFWGLSAAMLANPWAIALAAVVAAGYAIYQFTTRVETAADRTEKLNNAVASLKNLDDTVKPLIDTYNELIDKTERTAEEEKKLSEVTHELAKRYPGAITAIGDFGAEVDLATDKLNKLYQAEKNARMENTRYELGKTEEKIKETESEIEKLQQQLSSGTKTVYKRLGDSGLRTKKIEPLTEEDKGKILKRIDELRFGEDGQSGLVGLQQSAEDARRALGLIPSEAEAAVEKFGAWKKELRSFRVEVEGGANMQLFDDSTLNQFKSLDEAMAAAAKDYKEQIELVEHYNKALAEMSATSESRAKIEAERAEAEAKANANLAALTRFGYKPSDFDKSSGRGTQSDQRLSILQEMVSTLKQVNKEYDELAKKEGATKALADTQRVYADTFKNMQQLAAKYKFDLPDFGVPTDAASLTKYLKAVKDAMAKLPKSDKAVLALQVDIEKLNIDDMQKKIEKKLKDLSDKISRTKTAKEFYDKILSQTGDVDLAMNVTMSIYGDTGEGLFEQTIEQIKNAFKTGNDELDASIEAQIDFSIDTENQRINYQYLAEIYEYYQDQIIEKNRDTAQKIVSEGQKTASANILTWENELAKAKDYEQQRTDIIKRETERRAEIYKSNLPQAEKDRLTAQSRTKQSEDLAKINFEEFTKSEDYIKIFENLDNTSTAALKRLREEMQKLIETNKDLSPENMKTLVKAMEDIDEQISGRGFGNDMVQSVRDYVAALRDLKTARAELQTAQAEYDTQLPQLDADIKAAKDEEIAAQEALNALKSQELRDENAIVAAELRLNAATTAVTNAEQAKARAAEKVKKAEKEVTDQQDKQRKATNKFVKDLQKIASEADQLANILGDVKDLLGVSEDSAAGLVFDSAIGSLQTMSQAIEAASAAQALFNAIAESNPYIAIAAGVLAVGSAIGSWISGNKVRKANKEIKRQQELLDQLEYTYGRLEKAAEKLFGGEYLRNYNRQLKNLQAQAAAYQKQADAERSKGKKADKDKIKEYENSYRDTMDEIADMQGSLSERMLGSDLASKARDVARAWLDAYKEIGRAGANTTQAMKEQFQDMVENMVVEGALAAVMQRALQPMFDMIDSMNEQDFYSEAFWKKVAETAAQGAEDADKGAQILMKFLEQAGISIKDINTEYTGIKRDIAGASEETMSNVATIGNTLMYYVSPIPGIAANVALIRQLMETGTTSALPAASTGWTDWQKQAMDNYIAIQKNTYDTAVRCERAAIACETMVTQLRRVIIPKGSTASFGVQVYLPK